MRLSLVESVRRFKAVLNDPVLVAHGQFTFRFNYCQELRTLVQSTLASNSVLANQWLPKGALFDQIEATVTSPVDAAKFKVLVAQALNARGMNDGSAAAATMKRLLTASDAGGTAAHNTAHGFLAAGKPVTQGSAEFQKAYAPNNLTFPGAFRIGKLSQDRCFEMTNAVCSFIATKGGLQGRSGTPTNPDRVFVPEAAAKAPATVPSVRRNSDPALGDLLLYSSNLAPAIGIARKMLDHGHLLNAGVVSGVNADNRVDSPDHFLPLLAWEEFLTPIPHVVFAFWDPDANQSNDPTLGPSFGRVFFVNGADAQNETASGPNQATVAANFYKNGRFTTALRDRDLRVGPDGDDTSTGQHRYQITLMFAR